MGQAAKQFEYGGGDASGAKVVEMQGRMQDRSQGRVQGHVQDRGT